MFTNTNLFSTWHVSPQAKLIKSVLLQWVISACTLQCTCHSKEMTELIILISHCNTPWIVWLPAVWIGLKVSVYYSSYSCCNICEVSIESNQKQREWRAEQPTVGCFMGLSHTATHLKINRQFYALVLVASITGQSFFVFLDKTWQ